MPVSLIFVAMLVAQTRAAAPPRIRRAFRRPPSMKTTWPAIPDGEPPPLPKGIDWSLDKPKSPPPRVASG